MAALGELGLMPFHGNCVFGNIEITTMVFFAPFLAFLRPLFLLIGKVAGFTNIECPIVLV
jgi:hypothetical protein